MENKKYLDLEGLNYYHGKLVDNQITPLSGEIDLIGSNLSEYKTTTDATIDGIENTLGNKVDYTVSEANYQFGEYTAIASAASNGSVAIAVVSEYDPVEGEVSNGVIKRSFNGKDWETINVDPDLYSVTPRTIAYGDGIFCTDGVYSRDNGNTWEHVYYHDIAIYNDNETRGVHYSNGKFYAMSSGGYYGITLLESSMRDHDDGSTYLAFLPKESYYNVGDAKSFIVRDNICIVDSTYGLFHVDLDVRYSGQSCVLPERLGVNEFVNFEHGALITTPDKFYLPIYGIPGITGLESADGLNWVDSPDYTSILSGDYATKSFAVSDGEIYITAVNVSDAEDAYLLKYSGSEWVILQHPTIHGDVYYYNSKPILNPSPIQCTGGKLVVYAASAYGESKGIASGSIIGLGDTIINQINQTVIAAEDDEISGIFG